MMFTKHFFNDQTQLIHSSLRALTLTNPSITLDLENKIIYHRTDHAAQVSILSGGGSGHEPSFGAFVGNGLLSAAVTGTIFASPNADQIRKSLLRIESKKGVLVIIMNYTGDVLNFGIAIEKAKAAGSIIKLLVVGDDVGVGRKNSGRVGRRGIAGILLVHKIAGALAARKATLEDIYQAAKTVAENLVSVGASLAHVHVPGNVNIDSNSSGALGSQEVEIGMGIHNEPGCGKVKASISELVRKMLSQLLDPEDSDRAYLNVNSNEMVLLINNLGGLSVLELGGITFEVVSQLKYTYNIKLVRIFTGTYMSSLNCPGFSISLLNIVSLGRDFPSMLNLLDDIADCPGWIAPTRNEIWDKSLSPSTPVEESVVSRYENCPSELKYNTELAKTMILAALERLIAAEPEITKFDTVVGDGDCGIGLKKCAEAIQSLVISTTLSGNVVLDLNRIIQVVEKNLDGTSGALYTIFLNSLALNLRDLNPSVNKKITPKIWASALRQSCKNLKNYTPAQTGDRTLVDALHPFVEKLDETGDLFSAAIAANKGAQRTKGMRAKLGRTVYVGGTGYEEVPDPGAWGLSEFLLGLAGVSKQDRI